MEIKKEHEEVTQRAMEKREKESAMNAEIETLKDENETLTKELESLESKLSELKKVSQLTTHNLHHSLGYFMNLTWLSPSHVSLDRIKSTSWPA